MNLIKPIRSDFTPQRLLHLPPPTAEDTLYEIAPANMALRYYFLTDALALGAAFAMATLLALHVNFYYFSRAILTATSSRAALATACVLIASGLLFWLAHRNHYARRLPLEQEIKQVATGAGVCALLLGFFQLLNHAEFSRLWLIGTWSFAALFIILGRMLMRRILRQTGQWMVPTLYIGDEEEADSAQTDAAYCQKMGLALDASADAAVIAARLGAGETWPAILASYDAEAVAMATAIAQTESGRLWVMQWEQLKIPFACIAAQRDSCLMRLCRRLPQIGKRIFDLVIAITALIVLAPVFLVLALLIKRDGGPVFHADTRVGIDGKLIKCLKFRSMIVNADRELVRHLNANPLAAAEWARFQKLRHDPRITPIGRFIRKTSLDELPQLINVFWGEMTLVGPRPIIPNQKQAYGANIKYYNTVRPGITGLWQVSGRNRLTFRQRAKLDRWYVHHWSLGLDAMILLRTVPVLLLRKDAY